MIDTTQHHALGALTRREQEQRCRHQLTEMLDQDEPITAATARLIAACIHDGSGTALERFAATGRLNLELALSEMTDIRVRGYQTAWAVALWQYLEALDNGPPPETLTATSPVYAAEVA